MALLSTLSSQQSLTLQIRWYRNQIPKNIELISSLVASFAERCDIPPLVAAICLLNVCANQVAITTTTGTTNVFFVASLHLPIIQPRGITMWCSKSARSYYIFYLCHKYLLSALIVEHTVFKSKLCFMSFRDVQPVLPGVLV